MQVVMGCHLWGPSWAEQAPVAWMIHPINGLLQWPGGGIHGQLLAPVAPMIHPSDGVSSAGSVVRASPLAFLVRRKLSKVPLHCCKGCHCQFCSWVASVAGWGPSWAVASSSGLDDLSGQWGIIDKVRRECRPCSSCLPGPSQAVKSPITCCSSPVACKAR